MNEYTVDLEQEQTTVPESTDINISDLTSNVETNSDDELVGDGAFDKLMQTVEKHIKKQYDDGKITAESYAEVYLNSIVKVLDVSNTFVLESKVKNYQIQDIIEGTKLTASKKLLTDNQTFTEKSRNALTLKQLDREAASIDLTLAQVEEVRNYKTKEYDARVALTLEQIEDLKTKEDLTRKEIENTEHKILFTDSQTNLNSRQLLSIDIEDSLRSAQINTEYSKTRLVEAQSNTETVKTDLTREQIENTKADTSRTLATIDLTKKQINELDSKIDYTIAQINSIEVKNDNVKADTLFKEAQTNSVGIQDNLVIAQTETENIRKNEVSARTDLITAQTITEQEKVEELKARVTNILTQTEEANAKIHLTIAQTDTEIKAKDTEISRKNLLDVQVLSESAKKDNVEAHTTLINSQKITEDSKAVLINKQANTEDQKTELTKSQINQTISDTALTDKNITLIEKQKEELVSRIDKYSAETNSILNERKALTEAQTAKTVAEKDQVIKKTESITYEDNLTNANISKIHVDELYARARIDEIGARIEHTKAEIDSIVNYKNNNIHSNTLHNYAKIRTADYQNVLLSKQATVTEKQEALIERQTKGFDDDAKLRVLKEVLGNWSVGFSVGGEGIDVPDTVKINPIDSITKNLFDSLGIVNTDDPLGEK